MRVYVAGPWVERDRAREAARIITERGHTVTHNWWDIDGDGSEEPEFLRNCADQDIIGVLSADVVVVIQGTVSEGKAVEQGIALNNGIPVILIGEKRTNIFQYLKLFTLVPDLTTALEYLEMPKITLH